MRKTMALFFVFFIGIFSVIAKSEDDYGAMAIEAKRLAPSEESYFSQAVEMARQQEKLLAAPFINEAVRLKTQKRITVNDNMPLEKRIKNTGSKIFVFISFSMPRQSLIAYLSDAKKIHAILIMRGLIDNSFKKTWTEITNLVEAAHGGGIQLDPLLFKAFHITQVPTVIVLPDDPSVTVNQDNLEGKFDSITGDVPLFFALKEIRDRGNVAQEQAEDALSLMREPAHV